MKRITVFFVLAFLSSCFGTLLYGQCISLEGCSFIYRGITQYRIDFVSSDSCDFQQVDYSMERCFTQRVAYVVDGDFISLVGGETIEYTAMDSLTASKLMPCVVSPFVYVAGQPLNYFPLGGKKYKKASASSKEMIIKGMDSFSFPMRLTILSPLHLIATSDQNNRFYFEKEQDISATAPMRAAWGDRDRWRLSKAYESKYYTWRNAWFCREAYSPANPATSLKGKCFEYRGEVVESLLFIDDSICMYKQCFDDSSEQAVCCKYSIRPDGYLILQRNDKDPDEQTNHQRLGGAPNDEILHGVVNCITSDTLLLAGDFLVYSKIYMTDSCSVKKQTPMYMQKQNSTLVTKAFVSKDAKVSSRKIGAFFQRYFTPINFP